MSKETAFKALDFAISKSKEKLEIAYFGGEPLLEYELLQSISNKAKKECEKRGLKLVQSITTNGSLLDESRLLWFKKEDFFINLSIDGNEKMHNTHRLYADKKGSFADVKRALELLVKHYEPKRFKTITVVTPSNIEHLQESVEFLHTISNKSKIILSIDYFNNWSKHSKIYEEIFYELGKYVINSFKKGDIIDLEPFSSKILMQIKNKNQICQFGEFKYAISPRGTIYPCERLIGNDNKTLSIGDVFNGIDYSKWQEIIQNRGNKNSECRECEYKNRCNNSCGCTNYYLTGDIAKTDGVVCFFEKLTIDVSDFIATVLYKQNNNFFIDKYYK